MFLGHVNELGVYEYIPLIQYNNKQVLVKDNGRYFTVSNVCPHQKSIISTVASSGNRVCPYHNWTFDIVGNPITSGRTSYYCKNDTSLETHEVYEYSGLLFSTPVHFPIIENLKNLQLVEQRVDIVKANPENIMDLFLDVDHIQCVHQGVYDQIGIDDTSVEWMYYANGSIQTVKQGALWIALYPHTMIEWQQGMLFVTVAEKVNENESKVYVFKYKSIDSTTEEWLLNESVWETAWKQDKSQSELLTEFPKTNLEPGKKHYRAWKDNEINTQ
jgi:phenylpropionate dioxygenase-like ring-hydroxylating dioxygenase large terminal subunit